MCAGKLWHTFIEENYGILRCPKKKFSLYKEIIPKCREIMLEQHDLNEGLQNIQLNHLWPNKDKSHLTETKALFYKRKVNK